MSVPMVITAAMVGAETTREQTPYLPITAEEIAEDAAKCREAGAAMVHLHVRTADGKPSQDAELFRAAIRAIRKRTDIIVQTSTGGAVGMGVDERCGPLTLTGADRPDMATLTTGTVNFGPDVFWNPRPLVRDIARRIRALGIKPEIECFDVGMIDEASALAKEGLVDLPAHFDFVLGVGGALSAREDALEFMIKSLPPGSTWTVAAMGRHQLPFVDLAAVKGGNARVGLEDHICPEDPSPDVTLGVT
jgi:3-keto-5-aminohexanoate cleavage enzyme